MTRVVSRGILLRALLGGRTALGAPMAAVDPAADLTSPSLEELMQVEVVVGVSRCEQSVLDAPASVSILTAAEIRWFDYRTNDDVLRVVRGLFLTCDRNDTYVGVRGFQRLGDYNTHVLLLVDGHRLNENVYGGGYMGTEATLDVELLERVEVIRGSSSSLYGTSAFLAVVNLVTRAPEGSPPRRCRPEEPATRPAWLAPSTRRPPPAAWACCCPPPGTTAAAGSSSSKSSTIPRPTTAGRTTTTISTGASSPGSCACGSPSRRATRPASRGSPRPPSASSSMTPRAETRDTSSHVDLM